MKKNKKIYGIHPVYEFFNISPHRVLKIWIQESIKSNLIKEIHEAAKEYKLPIKVLKKANLIRSSIMKIIKALLLRPKKNLGNLKIN